MAQVRSRDARNKVEIRRPNFSSTWIHRWPARLGHSSPNSPTHQSPLSLHFFRKQRRSGGIMATGYRRDSVASRLVKFQRYSPARTSSWPVTSHRCHCRRPRTIGPRVRTARGGEGGIERPAGSSAPKAL
jgi:hypothetical protein